MSEHLIQGKLLEDPQYVEDKLKEFLEIKRQEVTEEKEQQELEIMKNVLIAVLALSYLLYELHGYVKDPNYYEFLESNLFGYFAIAKMAPALLISVVLYIHGRGSAEAILKSLSLDEELHKFSGTSQSHQSD